MKWIFIILVALNLIVFGGVVAQRMLLPAPQVTTERTVVVEKKVAANTQKTEEAEEKQTSEEKPIKTQSSAKEQTANTEKTEEIVTKTNPKSKPKQTAPKQAQKRVEKPQKAPVQKASNTTSTPSRKQKCGGASVTLPENVYHRIKGLLNEWPNAASREVGKSSGKPRARNEYVVIITPSAQQNDQMMLLMSKGFKPRQDKGLIILGQFSDRKAADALRQRVFAHGVHANVMEKHKPGKTGLSQANYRVIFMKINDADARKLSGILKPYAPLKRNPCK